MDINHWLDIPGYQGIYQILINQNKIRSLKFGKVRNIKTVKGIGGHIFFGIKENFKHKNMYLHRLVMLIKEGPCPEGMEVCHNDGNPSNNHPDNLRYGTRKDNVSDSIIHGTFHYAKCSNKGKFYGDNSKSLKVNQYSLESILLKEWDCIKSFLKTINREKDSSISKCCKGYRKTAYGYIWKYKK